MAMSAGIATLKALRRKGVYEVLAAKGRQLEAAFREAADAVGVPIQLHRVGSMLGAFFTPTAVWDYGSAKNCDTGRYGKFFRGMLKRGVYLAPSQFEAVFVSMAHGDKEMEITGKALRESMKELA